MHLLAIAGLKEYVCQQIQHPVKFARLSCLSPAYCGPHAGSWSFGYLSEVKWKWLKVSLCSVCPVPDLITHGLWRVIWRWYQWGDCWDERIFVKFYNQCPNKHLLNHLYFSYNCNCNCKWLFCETFLLMLVWKQQQCTHCYCSVQLYIYFQYGTLHYSTTLYRSGFENASLYLIYRSWLEVPW